VRRFDRGAAPSSLVGELSAGGRELARAKALYDVKANAKATFDFRAYKGDDVRDALLLRGAGKCVYCEASYAEVEPVDIEHYRPKSGYLHAGKLVKPGYWWLAAQWENLLPSCIDCNRAREHELTGAGGPRSVAGKASQFPVVRGTKRAKKPGEEATESPLLLDPAVDDPTEHLEFSDDGNVAPRRVAGVDSPRGAATITIVALRRKWLADARRAVAVKVGVAITHVEDTLRDLDWTTDAAGLAPAVRTSRLTELRGRLARDLAEVETYCGAAQRHSAVAETIARGFRARIGI